MTNPLLPFTRMNDRAIAPVRNNADDAGLDIFALEDVVVRPGEVVVVPTGIHIVLSEGQTGLFWDKSGRASKGLTVLGGCIDGPYRGELKIVATNTNIWPLLAAIGDIKSINPLKPLCPSPGDFTYPGYKSSVLESTTIRIPYGKAVTQMLVVETKFPTPSEVSREAYASLPPTSRGSKGFGSSDEVLRMIAKIDEAGLGNHPATENYLMMATGMDKMKEEIDADIKTEVEALGGFRKVSIAVKFAETIGTQPPESAAEVEVLYQMAVGLAADEEEQGGSDG